ncbi:MAG: methylmalonyl-CoA mutase [Rhodospirillaceae bacterium]|jgi:methylmalonyl-CoA mutase C-terminal domain/subunit|nr:methylmalonyl-CoA mutase [Rhodospirillaceae bacterium]MBT3495283.1 methylmalonyl-CoA mutase [Rhodospirillaceae bacterium]MBT3779343.1 methylmalonyl-CoA mutase [Rhodospirillaceae bacterium]MBT3975687.1 methylmalonyl-CoA mutase [Rhodospirillaceae bacterium]MBT4167646.1 methylmalonyl-CoA mutase [Rhodospirillaceae bacterium]
MTEVVRVLLAKPTHDGHDRGVRYIARKFRDAGFEVIFTTFLLADEVAAMAIEEDVNVIGISSSSHGHMAVFEDLFASLKKHGLEDILVIGGGVISGKDQAVLKEWGVARVFGPGSSSEDSVEFIRQQVSA